MIAHEILRKYFSEEKILKKKMRSEIKVVIRKDVNFEQKKLYYVIIKSEISFLI
jgi:hypothetical protein